MFEKKAYLDCSKYVGSVFESKHARRSFAQRFKISFSSLHADFVKNDWIFIRSAWFAHWTKVVKIFETVLRKQQYISSLLFSNGAFDWLHHGSVSSYHIGWYVFQDSWNVEKMLL